MNTQKSWTFRAATTGSALAAILMLGATAAQAADYWQYWGPKRPSASQAQSDLTDLQKQCRRDGGYVQNSGLLPAYPPDGEKQAFVHCQALRAGG